jgi:hypothetical protein
MADVLSIVDPVELTGFVRSLIDASYNGPDSLERFLPENHRLVTEYEFNYADRDRPEMGRYRAFDAESGLQSRPGFSKVRGSIPPISEKMLLSEADRTRLEVALRSGDTQSRYLRDLVFNDAERLTTSVLARVEYARGLVLSTGKFTFTTQEGSLLTEVDYNDGVSAIQTNTASPLWSDTASATPIVDLRGWMDDYADATLDEQPVVGITSREVITAARNTDEVKDYFTINNITPSIIRPDQFNELLSIQGIPPLVEYRTRVTLGGTATRVLPDNKIIWLPAASVDSFGETMFGVGADSLDLVEMFGLPSEAASGFTGRVWKEIDPPQHWTRVGGMVIPVLKDPRRIMVSTVLA